ncbi:M20/M25/M40 family metallo-hydrolase [Lacinutrix sp. WUR7]|uniref:M28 family metallopeptidase n=1 Tax=Lacinutrix sp. WUR7 TaxID=2653681 RepID=UPI00193D1999|nr:M20/M25/M40 family metallo-hydrolase [Lacinutrix sp. WUR7]QRM89467.1 M20/M25/M40 family metallo-hydrolase [Lacinutrix sp. WUR7]
MRKILALLILVSILSCGSSKVVTNTESTSESAMLSHNVKPIEASISLESIQKSMEYLASDELEGRATGSVGIEKAALFIETFLKDNNIKPYFETYRDDFEIVKKESKDGVTNNETIKGFNIVGVVEGNDPKLKNEYIILGGHYDHIGFAKEVDGDIIANGANDDASGTIAAMELAAYFAKTKTNKRSILVTLYSAEEMGLKGSAHLAKRLKEAGLNAYTMINFEMIGVPRTADNVMAYMSGFERSNFAETLNRYAGEEIIGFFPKAKEFNLFMRSDNFPFYNELNIPAHAISTFDFTNFEYYHHVDDEASEMDYEHMSSFMNKMIPALKGMMNAPTKEVKLKDE